MNKDEVLGYVKVGSSSFCIDKKELKDYEGIYRKVAICNKTCVEINYKDKYSIELGEGELTFYFNYKSYDELIESLEVFLGKQVGEWRRLNYEEYENLEKECDLHGSWRKLKKDFVDRKLEFPKGYSYMVIQDIYWKGLYNKEISVEATEEDIERWFDNKLREEANIFEDI